MPVEYQFVFVALFFPQLKLDALTKCLVETDVDTIICKLCVMSYGKKELHL